MEISEKLVAERRARLAAERLLDLKSRELFRANEQLSDHALRLSGQIVEQRQVVQTVRQEAEDLKGHNAQTQEQLIEAEHKIVVAERRLWDSVETIADGFAVFDREDRLIAANSAWLMLFDPGEIMSPGVPFPEAMQITADHGHLQLDGCTPDEWTADIAARWTQSPVPEHMLSLQDGRHFRLVDRRSRDGDMVCLSQDITSIKQREAQLNEARKSAEAAARAKSAFLANMSHELRTPLNGVVSMAELVLEMEIDTEQEIYLQTIKNSGNALLAIINDVLDFSKLEAERMVIHPEAFDLEKLLHEVLLLLAPTARDKNLSLHIDYDLFLPKRMIADPGRLRQIMTNLVGNAVKFTADGHVLIRVVGIEREDHTWQIHITVEDTGIGIPEDKKQHIFGSFSQVDDERNRQFEGTGLGLAICHQLVELMDGDIWVESELGKGACFGIRLDLPCAEPTRRTPTPIEPGLALAFLIGNNTLEQEILTRQLAQLGVAAELFQSSAEAIAAIQSGPHPQFLFVEDQLATLSGAELVTQVRNHGLNPFVLMITSQKALKAGGASVANATLVRPVLRTDLLRALASLEPHSPPCTKQLPAAPQTPPVPKAVPPLDPQVTAPLQNAQASRKMRVLAAEDNKTNRFVFSKMVKNLMIELEFAENGLQAVEKFQSYRPDAIFMDISMPTMDGKQATVEIRKLEAGSRRVPIVAVTAHAVTGDEEDILSFGLDHYITKPLKKAELLGLIEDLCPEVCENPFPAAK